MANQLIEPSIYNQDKERCEHFFQTGKSYNYNDCCIKFFIERAIKKTYPNIYTRENRPFIGLSTGLMLCPECSLMNDHESLKLLCRITKDSDECSDCGYYYTKHPECETVRLN